MVYLKDLLALPLNKIGIPVLSQEDKNRMDDEIQKPSPRPETNTLPGGTWVTVSYKRGETDTYEAALCSLKDRKIVLEVFRAKTPEEAVRGAIRSFNELATKTQKAKAAQDMYNNRQTKN